MALTIPDREVRFKPQGVMGGLENRVCPTSPRKIASEGTVVAKARQLQRPKAAPRLAENDFIPNGFQGLNLEERAEEELDSLIGQHPWNEATEYFVDSAKAYFNEGNYMESGNVYVRGADCLLKMRHALEAAPLLVQAAQSYAATETEEGVARAIEALSEVIDIYKANNRPRNVARLYLVGGSLFASIGNFDDAEDWHMQSAVLYAKLNDSPMQHRCLLQCADLQFKSENFDLASSIWEEVATLTINDYITGKPRLPRLEVPLYFFKSVVALACKADQFEKGIDRLAQLERAEMKFRKYTDLDLEHFNTGLEHETCKRFLSAAIKQDVKGLQDSFNEYWTARNTERVVRDIIQNRIIDSMVRYLAKIAEMYGM